MRKPTYDEVMEFFFHLAGVEASIGFWRWLLQ